MRISAPRFEKAGSRVRVAARVEWEDCDRPGGDVVFETEAAGAGEFQASPEAFAVICALSARRDGERRLRIEAPLCPQLRDGLAQAFSLLEWWFPVSGRAPRIEATEGFRILPSPRPRAASLLSGGVDSLRLIQANRRHFAPDHPRSLKDGLFLYGFMNHPDLTLPAQENLVERQRECVEAACRIAGMRLLAVRIDVNVLRDDRFFNRTQGHGAKLAAIAHVFSSLSTVSLAASFFATELLPWGSHPLLDPCFGSSSIEVRHEGLAYRRIESVRALLDWPEILPYLMVCGEAPIDPGFSNCGRCEKCLRTILELDMAGGLEAATSFPPREVTAADLDGLDPNFSVHSYWMEIVEPLRARARPDLADAARRVVDRSIRTRDWLEGRGSKGWIRRFDRRHLSGRLVGVARSLRRLGS